MLRLILIFSIFYTVGSSVFCQSQKVISIEFDRQKISYNSYQAFTSLLQSELSDYTINNSSIIVVQPTFRKSGIKKIEGMDTKNVGKATVLVKIKNSITNQDSLVKKEYSISGANEYDIEKNIMAKVSEDKEFISSISIIVNKTYDTATSLCGEYVTQIKNLESKKGVLTAMEAANRVLVTIPECDGQLSSYTSELKDQYDKEVCEKILYEAQIFVNSGVSHQMNKAVSLLLRIPPTATCKAEALKISEDLSTKMNLTQENKTKLSEYKRIMGQNNNGQWVDLMNGNN